jgi:hypothetical protein
MSGFAKINLLEVEDSIAGRVEGLDGRFGRKRLDSRDLGVSLFRLRPEPAQPDGSQPQTAGGSVRRCRRLRPDPADDEGASYAAATS